MEGAESGDIDKKKDPDHDKKEAELNKKCCKAFQNFVENEHARSSNLTEADKKLGRTTTVKKLVTGPMGESPAIANVCDASVFPRFQNKAKKVSDVDFVTNLLPALAIEKKKHEVKNKKKGAVDMKPDDIVAGWKDKIAATVEPTETTTTKTAATKTAAVVDRLTDAKKYTGSHKERFDDSGKGKGKDGRADVADNSGYVGNYKGEGTFGTKK